MALRMVDPTREVGRAWLALCFVLTLHVLDEAATGFLAVYNATVVAIRKTLPWSPLPVFRFEIWLAGLVAVIIALFSLSPLVFRGVRGTRAAGYVFAGLMAANAVGHMIGTAFGKTVETVVFSRPMPGFYSSPILLAASMNLLFRLRSSRAERA